MVGMNVFKRPALEARLARNQLLARFSILPCLVNGVPFVCFVSSTSSCHQLALDLAQLSFGFFGMGSSWEHARMVLLHERSPANPRLKGYG